MKPHRVHLVARSRFLDRAHLGPLIALLLGAALLSATAMASVYAAGGGPAIDLPEAADHGRAGQDHSPPESPPASAQNAGDHGQSDEDHGRAGADHGQADDDHGQAAGAGAAFTATQLESQQRKFFRSAQNVGLSRTEILEVIAQTGPYSGFPQAFNALAVAEEVLP